MAGSFDEIHCTKNWHSRQLCLQRFPHWNIFASVKARLRKSNGMPTLQIMGCDSLTWRDELWAAQRSEKLALGCILVAVFCSGPARAGYCGIWFYLHHPDAASPSLAIMPAGALESHCYVRPPPFSLCCHNRKRGTISRDWDRHSAMGCQTNSFGRAEGSGDAAEMRTIDVDSRGNIIYPSWKWSSIALYAEKRPFWRLRF